jgi:protein subunit release factor B
MYMKWGQSKNHSVSLLEAIPDGIGYRNAIIRIDGEYVYGWLKHESGIHRMSRVSKTDAMVSVIHGLSLKGTQTYHFCIHSSTSLF